MTSKELAIHETHIHRDKYRRRSKRVTKWKERYPAEEAGASLDELKRINNK